MDAAEQQVDFTRGFEQQHSVLFVDDEIENLRVFELAFRRDFHILTAQSGSAALDILAAEPAAVVLSDQRMPGMSGVEFLARVREFDPHTVRMLVTAYGDFETLSSAINQGSISRFIPKPWSPEEMRHTIRQGIEAYRRDAERRVLLGELDVLNRAGTMMCAELDLEALLTHLLDVVVGELGFDGASALLCEPGAREVVVARNAPRRNGVCDEVEGLRFPVGAIDAIRDVMRSGKAQCIDLSDVYATGGAVTTFASEIASDEMLFVPFPGRAEPLGVLAVDNRRGGATLEHANHKLLCGLAAQASIAIENARLVEDLRQSQELTRRADRLGTLGTLAAGLAHEINNPLVAIQTFLKMAPEKRDTDDPEFWEKYHQLACREAERIHTLVHTMSQLGADPETRPKSPASLPVNFGEVCQKSLQLVEGSARAGAIELETEFAPDLVKAVGVADHLHQVVTNLLLNAIHATPAGGRVALRVANLEGAKPQVVLTVQDWGAGIAPEVLERVFDPFFTTKAPDQGAGLGLMIAHRIVTDHGGAITVESGEGQGSTFRVVLPAD